MTALNNLLQTDHQKALQYFPKLKLIEREDKREITGQLDICDIDGRYWDTYSIRILVPPQYPCGVPQLYETSGKIRRSENRHLDSDGLCCVDMEHELIIRSYKGLHFDAFLRDYVYPFLANQIYYDFKKEFANGEYKHEHFGVEEYYKKKLNLPDPNVNIQILRTLIGDRMIPSGICFCGSGRMTRNCHANDFKRLRKVGYIRLIEDYHSFRKILNPIYTPLNYFLKKSQQSPVYSIFVANQWHRSCYSNAIPLGNSKK